MRSLYFVVCILIFNGCETPIEESYFDMPYDSEKNISVDRIVLDTLSLDSCSTSFVGEFSVRDDRIYFMDARFCTVFEFDLEGKYITRHIGLGKGPNETWLGVFEAFTYDPDKKETVFTGPSRDAHLFDKNWQSIWYFKIQNFQRGQIPVNAEPSTVDPGLYALETVYPTVGLHDGKMYVSITTDHPYCNPFLPVYYEKCPIIAQIDLATGGWDRMFGRRSPEYLKREPLGQHSFFSFVMDRAGKFYVNFEIDPKIYVYDQNYEPLYSFGEPGVDMDTNYGVFRMTGDLHSESNLHKINELYMEDRPKRGFYTYLNYIDDRKLLFRSYTKGQISTKDGLQIYQDNTLIGDVEVPKNFKVTGYSEAYFYGQTKIEELSERLKIFKFKLPVN